MRHLDLFSGIGGFAYAADQVFGDVEHIFCDNDKFCQQVLKKHWPEAKIYDDIRSITNTDFVQSRSRDVTKSTKAQKQERKPNHRNVNLLTGGFPCQPFSAAGLRRGTADDRHLWPEMLRVIRLTKPQWVIAENVRGLLNWDEGVVFEQVCADLESEGYSIQPFIIPAVAVNAPHRRDRIWFVAHDPSKGRSERLRQETNKRKESRQERNSIWNHTRAGSDTNYADPERKRLAGYKSRDDSEGQCNEYGRNGSEERFGWSEKWTKVATELCGVDDGLPARLDGFELSKSQHRKERLKSLGNAIVPQVAMEIMRGIQLSADYK